jgi:hypothetical protein
MVILVLAIGGTIFMDENRVSQNIAVSCLVLILLIGTYILLAVKIAAQ